MKWLPKVFLLIFVILALHSCDWISEKLDPTWTGHFYPDGDLVNEHKWRMQSGFDSLEACRSWARNQIQSEDDDYECGKNCHWRDEYGLYVCEETLR